MRRPSKSRATCSTSLSVAESALSTPLHDAHRSEKNGRETRLSQPRCSNLKTRSTPRSLDASLTHVWRACCFVPSQTPDGRRLHNCPLSCPAWWTFLDEPQARGASRYCSRLPSRRGQLSH